MFSEKLSLLPIAKPMMSYQCFSEINLAVKWVSTISLLYGLPNKAVHIYRARGIYSFTKNSKSCHILSIILRELIVRLNYRFMPKIITVNFKKNFSFCSKVLVSLVLNNRVPLSPIA
ncbi:hypothetical protein MXB_4924, partial [Myxobolus squamalis]